MIAAAVYFIIILLIIRKSKNFQLSGTPCIVAPSIFSLKVAAGIILYIIYEYHYNNRTTSDAFRYYDDAIILKSELGGNLRDIIRVITGFYNDSDLSPKLHKLNNWYKPFDTELFNDNRTVIRVHLVFSYLPFANYHVHSVLFNLISFFGLRLIYQAYHDYFIGKEMLLILAVFLIPGVAFWSSGPLKESLLFLGLGLISLGIERLKTTKALIQLFLILPGLFILFISKNYLVFCLIPSIIFYFSGHGQNSFKAILKFVFIFLGFIVVCFNLKFLSASLDFGRIISNKQRDFINVASEWDAKSRIEISEISPEAISLIKPIPQALINVFFRPWPWESKNIMMLLSAAENVFLFFLVILVLIFYKKPDKRSLQLILYMAGFVILLAMLTGIVTPVLGAIVRYKVPLLPYLYIILFMMLDYTRLMKILKLRRV